MKNVHTLTKNLLTGALLLLLLTIGALLATPQDAQAQLTVSVSISEPTGTQTTETFKARVTLSHVASAGVGGGGTFTTGDVTVTTTRTSGSGDATVVSVFGSGKIYDVEIKPPSNAAGSITLTIKANSIGAFHNTQGWITGPSSAKTSNSISFDTTNLLTVGFTEPTGVQTSSTFTVPIAFSHSVPDFAEADITVATTRTSGSGDATVSLTGSGSSYTATVTPPTNAIGGVTLTVKKDSVTFNTNLNGPSTAETSKSISFDTSPPPTVSFTEPAGTQAGTTFTVPITISKSVTGFVASDITVTTTRTSGTGNATVALSGSGSSYTATVTSPTTAKGTITLEVAANSVTDGSNRTGPTSATTSSAIDFDTTVPTVSFSLPTTTQAGATFGGSITFSKSVTGFDQNDLTITTTRTSGTGDATFTLNGSGKTYTVTVTLPSAAKGTVTLEVAKDAVTDGTRTGPSSKATSSAVNFDTTAPTVAFTEPADTQTGTTFDVPITFSKSVTGFSTADITITTTRTSGTGNATFTLSGSGEDYTATVTSPTAAKGTITLEIRKNAAIGAGKRSGPVNKVTSSAIAFDTTVPTVTYTEPAGTQAAATFDVPITISKSVTGFAASDITVTTTRTSGTGDATVALSGSGTSYTATVTSPTAAKGTITLEVAKDAVTDGTRTGPASKATSSAISFDTTVATVDFTEPAGTQVADTFDVPITISKSVTGFAASDITVTSSTGTASVSLSGSGSSYTATVTSPTAAKGTITLEVAKDAVTDGTRSGPASKATSSAISFDTTVATVDFTEPAGTQIGDSFTVPITINKSVTGLAASDITITTTRTSGTENATFTLSGSGKDYTVTVTSPSAAKGTVTLEVAKDAVTDGTRTGPASKATSSAISFDTTVATVSFTEPAGTQTANTFTVPITFSKSVTGFNMLPDPGAGMEDLTVITTLTSGTGDATVSVSGSGTSYTATVTSPTAAKGTITLEVAANAVTDGTRTGPASKVTSSAISFDTTVATLSFTEPAGTQIADTFDVPITISKSVTGFAASDITVTSSTGTASVSLSGSGTSYTATVTSPTAAKGTITLEVAKDAVTDGTRTGPASKATSSAISFDTTVPTVTYTEPAGTQYANTFTVPITFSKSVTGFTTVPNLTGNADLTVKTTRTSGTGNATVSLSGSGASYTATITSPTAAKGTITLEIGADSVTDGTRTGPASKATSSAISFDTTVTTVSFNEPAGTQYGNTFDVPITFSKSVTGFATSDLTLTSSTGTASVSLSGSGTSYTATVTSPTAAKGTITLEVAKDAVTDGTRTGPASKATSSAINFDTTVATVSFNEPAGTQYGNTFDVPITFSKSVTGFATSDLTLTSSTGTASVSLSGSGTSYTATVTSPTAAQGTITLEVAKDAVTDGTRTAPASKATSSAISFDTTVATVSFDEPNGVQTANNFDVGIDFSKSVTGFAASDISLTTTLTSGSGTPTVSLSGSGSAYTATITSLTTAKGTIVLEVAKDAVTDGTRTGPASKAVSATITFDTTAPTVTFSEPEGTQTADTFTVGINFSKSVTGFEAGDLTLTTTRTHGAGEASFTLNGSGKTYTATVTSPTEAKGTVKLEIAKDAASDGTKQVPKNRQASQNIAFDTTTPAVTYEEPQGVQIAKTFDVGILFSKSVTGFEAGDIRLTTTHKVGTSGTGNASLTLKGSGTSWTARITPPRIAIGTVRLTIAANAVTDGTRTGPAKELIGSAIAFDTTVATVSFTEPVGVQTFGTFNVPITFSKSVTGFNTVNNPHNRAGVVSDLMVTTIVGSIRSENIKVILIGSGADYVATITIPTAAKGIIKLEVARGAATDGARPAPAQKTTSNAIAFDTTGTTVSFSEPAGNPQRTDTFNVGITFSRSVTGFEKGDITIKTKYNSGSGNAAFTLSGSDSDYTAAITVPSDAIGTLTLEVAANAATDGTRTTPANKVTSKAIAFDTTTPTVSFTVPSDTQTNAFDIGITFSRSVTGFELGDLTVTTTRTSGTGVATCTLAGSGTDYTATITPPADAIGKVTLTVKADAATDGVRKGPSNDASVTVSFDTQANTAPGNTAPGNIGTINPGGTSTETDSTGSDNSHIDRIIFNEIYNGTSDKNDWIELRNAGDYAVDLEGWEIGIVKGNGETLKEKKIVTLPYHKLLPNDSLLIVNTLPIHTDIAPGINIGNGRYDEADLETWNTAHYLRTDKLKLPVKEKYLLTLRFREDKIGTLEDVVDVVGTYLPNNLDYEGTLLWPLQVTKPTGLVPALEPDVAWRRIYNVSEPRGYIAAAWTASGYQEGRGYDKDAPKETSLGTPGLRNDFPFSTNLPSGPVSVSEIMFATRNTNRAAPQWIEFYNTSTKTVDLRGWHLNLEMRAEYTLKNETLTFTFEGVHVGPKQTLLIVTHKGSNSGHFPEHKIYDLSVQQKDLPGSSELLNANQYLLSSAGFSLMLTDANGKVVDKIGNLDGDPKTTDAPKWQLPSGNLPDGKRSSLLRRYKAGEPLPGTDVSSWRLAKDLPLSSITYWGHRTDIGNPGYRKGGYLPVSLSHFNAVFTGTEVVLKWTTESELDNAGFNIYRSESQTGEFVLVNVDLIQGAGTTAERQQYEWKDTTAKPNVSYYYQIEDVSFSGVQEQLQTVRMRGHVSASGKALRTWASLKSDK